MRVTVAEGKYTFVRNGDGTSHVLRYGEPWRDTLGDNFIYCAMYELDEARRLVEILAAVINNSPLVEQPHIMSLLNDIPKWEEHDECIERLNKEALNRGK